MKVRAQNLSPHILRDSLMNRYKQCRILKIFDTNCLIDMSNGEYFKDVMLCSSYYYFRCFSVKE